jgi:hypothetical protein
MARTYNVERRLSGKYVLTDYGLLDKSFGYLRAMLCSLRHRLWDFPREFLHKLLWEVRSLVWRMRFQRGRIAGIDFGPTFEDVRPNEPLVLCKRTLVRKADTQETFSNRRWASLVDYLIFLEGWDRGEKSCMAVVHNADSDNLR